MPIVKSWRDIGKLGYGSGGHADSPWARQGIFVMNTGGTDRGVNTGGPGLPPSRRKKLENPGLKSAHEFVEANYLCLTCNMMKAGHDRLIARLTKETN